MLMQGGRLSRTSLVRHRGRASRAPLCRRYRVDSSASPARLGLSTTRPRVAGGTVVGVLSTLRSSPQVWCCERARQEARYAPSTSCAELCRMAAGPCELQLCGAPPHAAAVRRRPRATLWFCVHRCCTAATPTRPEAPCCAARLGSCSQPDSSSSKFSQQTAGSVTWCAHSHALPGACRLHGSAWSPPARPAAAQVLFRTLGLIPGSASQDGEWKALDGRRYQVRARLPLRCCPA